MKAVIQYTRDGDHKIARYQSMAEAAKAMGVTKQCVWNVIHIPEKFKRVNGYVFKLEQEEK